MKSLNLLKKTFTVLLSFTIALGMGACQPHTETTAKSPPSSTVTTCPPATTTGQTTCPPETTVPTEPETEKTLVVIDAGHQAKGNYEKEPLGPGSDVMKTKVAAGATGVVTGLEEYKLTLMVALKLQSELEQRGYEVIMIRTSHDVDISNAERAQIANAANADAFIRIHGNSFEQSSAHGALTMCQTKNNPFNGALYRQCRALSEYVLDGLVNATGCHKREILETDTMSGINWCQVPVTIVEMGFMSNPEEDALMATEDYQIKLAQGIANGIDAYFSSLT